MADTTKVPVKTETGSASVPQALRPFESLRLPLLNFASMLSVSTPLGTILTVTLPKSTEAQKAEKKITVKSG